MTTFLIKRLLIGKKPSMNKDAFYNYILHPELLDDRTLKELQLLMDEYPFFQTGRLLYLKNLNNQGSISYERELRKNAVWVTNRNKLFYLLDKRTLLPITLEDTFTAQRTNFDNGASIDFSELTEITEFESLPEEKLEIKRTPVNDELEQLIMSGAAQAGTFFDVDDQVNLEEFKNTFKKKKAGFAKYDKAPSPEQLEAIRRNNLIDNFILEQPRIVPKEASNQDYNNKGEPEVEINHDMITDTLAKIYIKQGFYEKAISAYEKLSLKYPEKNSYFAGQIKKIKQIINNQ